MTERNNKNIYIMHKMDKNNNKFGENCKVLLFESISWEMWVVLERQIDFKCVYTIKLFFEEQNILK